MTVSKVCIIHSLMQPIPCTILASNLDFWIFLIPRCTHLCRHGQLDEEPPARLSAMCSFWGGFPSRCVSVLYVKLWIHSRWSGCWLMGSFLAIHPWWADIQTQLVCHVSVHGCGTPHLYSAGAAAGVMAKAVTGETKCVSEKAWQSLSSSDV